MTSQLRLRYQPHHSLPFFRHNSNKIKCHLKVKFMENPKENMLMINKTYTIVYTASGVALFFVLSYLLLIPIGTSPIFIDLGYIVLFVFALKFGSLSGLMVGFLGHTLKDILIFGSIIGSWAPVTGLLGLLLGLFAKYMLKNIDNSKTFNAFNSIIIILSNAVCWIGIAPLYSTIVLGVDYRMMLTFGMFAFISNSLTMLILGQFLYWRLVKLWPAFSMGANNHEN